MIKLRWLEDFFGVLLLANIFLISSRLSPIETERAFGFGSFYRTIGFPKFPSSSVYNEFLLQKMLQENLIFHSLCVLNSLSSKIFPILFRK